jgi:exosortase
MSGKFAGFSAAVVVSLALWMRPIAWIVSIALVDDRYTYLLVVVPLAALLFALEYRALLDSARPAPIAFVILPLAAVVAFSASRSTLMRAEMRLAIEMAALVAWWIGAFVGSFGMGAAKRERFVLGFLVLSVPLPAAVIDKVVAVLQWGSIFSTEMLFKMFAVPVVRHATILEIPGLQVNIAAECSSIRSTLFLLVATILLARFWLRSNWRRGLLVALVLPISMARNAIRIFTISILATEVDSSFLTGHLHRGGGPVFYAGSVFVIGLSLFWLARGERRRVERPELKASHENRLRGKSVSS